MARKAVPHWTLRGALGHTAVAELVEICAERAIPVMPLKGVLLQALVDGRPGCRFMRDVDVLVPPDRFEEAIALLERRGHRWLHRSRSGIEESLRSPCGLVVDVHRRLFPAHRFRMTPGEVFSRARDGRDVFGPGARLPDPHDLYAHLVGKLVTDHADERQAWRLQDVIRVSRTFELRAASTGAHLERCGMRRAARYALPLVVDTYGDRFASDVLAGLGPDPVGHLLAGVCRVAVARLPQGATAGSLPAHLLESSLRRSARSLGHTVARRLAPPSRHRRPGTVRSRAW